MSIQGAHSVILFKQHEYINVSHKMGTVGQDLQPLVLI